MLNHGLTNMFYTIYVYNVRAIAFQSKVGNLHRITFHLRQNYILTIFCKTFRTLNESLINISRLYFKVIHKVIDRGGFVTIYAQFAVSQTLGTF